MLLIITVLAVTACAESGPYPSAASVAGEWLEIKRELDTDSPASPAAHIGDFRITLERFLASPVGLLYKVHKPEEMRAVEAAIPYLENLLSAHAGLAPGNGGNPNQPLFSITLEIDTAIDLLRDIDEALSDTSLLRYFQLFFFFTVLVIIIILALRMLYSRLNRAERRERQTRTFSRETIVAQDQERARIARELHDTVAQDLWRLSFQTDSIAKAADATERSRLCAEVVGGQKGLMRRIRDICDNLIPPDFQRRGLADTLGSYCYNFRQRTGIECQLTVQKDLRLDSLDNDTQLQCFRIVQECLANIEKHAEAKEAAVLVRSGEETLLVSVSDSGRGFSPPGRDESGRLLTEGHYGVWGMYERAAAISGTLTVDSSFGEGAIISLMIPFKSES